MHRRHVFFNCGAACFLRGRAGQTLRVVCSHARLIVRRQELLLLRVFFTEDHQRNVCAPIGCRRPQLSRCSERQPEATHGRLQSREAPRRGHRARRSASQSTGLPPEPAANDTVENSECPRRSIAISAIVTICLPTKYQSIDRGRALCCAGL